MKIDRIVRKLFPIAACFSAQLALAQDSRQPFFGQYIGLTDGDLIYYECIPSAPQRITCDFTQILFQKKKVDLSEEQRVEILESLNGFGNTENICNELDPIKLRSAKESSSEHLREGISALERLCADKSEEALNQFLAISESQNAETCRPIVNRFSQEFVEVSDTLWVVESSPSGLCGVVNTSRFLKETDESYFWNYEASKIVTNKEGTGLVPCNELSEEPQTYAWDQEPVFKNCRYFE